MDIPRPNLSIRVLPLLDIIFLLLAFFIIIPHGNYPKKAANIPPQEKLQDKAQIVEVVEDIPLFVRIEPENQLVLLGRQRILRKKKTGRGIRRGKLQKTIANQKEWENFVVEWKEILQRAEELRKEKEELWRKRGGDEGESRPPRIFIQVEVHPLATIRLPIQIVEFLKKLTNSRREYIYALRRIE